MLIINSLVIPYKDANDTISLYTSICLYGQMFMVLLALMVLASFSLGRERERRTIITTGSKPLSRLEFFLGKIVGFSTVGLALLVFMGFVTNGYLLVAEQRVRSNARALAIRSRYGQDYEAAQHSAATQPTPKPGQSHPRLPRATVRPQHRQQRRADGPQLHRRRGISDRRPYRT